MEQKVRVSLCLGERSLQNLPWLTSAFWFWILVIIIDMSVNGTESSGFAIRASPIGLTFFRSE